MPDPMTMMMILNAITGVGSALTSNKGEMGSTFNKNQLSTLDDILNQVKGMGNQDITQNQGYQTGQNWLQSMFNDPEFFKSFEAPLQRQFQEQTVPELANRFAGMGSGGALGSTAFRNQLGREGSNLSTNIAALRGGMQQQAIPQMLGYAQQPFNNYLQMLQQALQPTQNVYQPPSAGPFGGAFAAGTGGMMQGLINQGFGVGGGGGMGGGNSAAGTGAGWDSMFRQQGVF